MKKSGTSFKPGHLSKGELELPKWTDPRALKRMGRGERTAKLDQLLSQPVSLADYGWKVK